MENFVNNWVKYLEDTRNEMYIDFIHPITDILKSDLSDKEKINLITNIEKEFSNQRGMWDVKNYGIFLT